MKQSNTSGMAVSTLVHPTVRLVCAVCVLCLTALTEAAPAESSSAIQSEGPSSILAKGDSPKANGPLSSTDLPLSQEQLQEEIQEHLQAIVHLCHIHSLAEQVAHLQKTLADLRALGESLPYNSQFLDFWRNYRGLFTSLFGANADQVLLVRHPYG